MNSNEINVIFITEHFYCVRMTKLHKSFSSRNSDSRMCIKEKTKKVCSETLLTTFGDRKIFVKFNFMELVQLMAS